MYTGKKTENIDDENAPRAKVSDYAWESEELEDAIHEPISGHSQTNTCRIHAEPSKLNQRRPDEGYNSLSYHL